MFQLILVPWDASDLCGRALDAAVQLAREYEAEIVAVSVLTPSGPDRETAMVTFDQARKAADTAGVPITHDVIEGRRPAHDLHAYAHSLGFDLIVVGHHRDHRPGVLMLHGVTEHLVSECEVPLLVVPGPPRGT
jgi:nucleotide-binding universal stress UspA family protein